MILTGRRAGAVNSKTTGQRNARFVPRIPCALLLAVLPGLFPNALHAQLQAPTPEELKMTEEPKAPGASAIYLYREETTDEVNHYHSYWVRIKVLTEKGKELATIRTPYERGTFAVSDIEGRTIHADGTVIPLTANPEDLTDYKSKNFQVNTMVFTLPDVQVGSILEYRLKLRYSDEIVSEPEWQIQRPYFVRKAHYYFRPDTSGRMRITNNHGDVLDRLAYSFRIDNGVKVAADTKGGNVVGYSLDLTDIPPLPDEDWMPPLNTIRWNVRFYYTDAKSLDAFWDKTRKAWANDVDHFANATGGLKKAMQDIVAPGDSDSVKATKIYDAIMKLDNTDFSRTKSHAERKAQKLKDIHDAEDVWKQKSGSSAELALLYVAMAKSAGLTAWPMQVVDRNRAFFNVNYYYADQLDDYLAIVLIDGKEVYLDPGEKMCPYGQLHWKHALASGLRLSDKGVEMGTTPPANYKAAVVQRSADLTLDETGTVDGSVHWVMTGPDALYWRQLAIEDDEDEVKKQFNEMLREYFPDGTTGELDHFLGLDDYSVNLMAVLKVSGTLGTGSGKRFFLPGLFFESRAKHPFVGLDKRQTPIDVHYSKTEKDDVTYRLPPGFAVESAPQDANSSWPDHALMKISSTTSGTVVNVQRTLLYNYILLGPTDYPTLHDFYQKIAAADQQQLVLTRVPATKGN